MPVTFTAGSGFATFEVDVGTKSYSFAKKEQIAVEDIGWIQKNWPTYFLPYSATQNDGTYFLHLLVRCEKIFKKPQNVSAAWRFYDQIFYNENSLILASTM